MIQYFSIGFPVFPLCDNTDFIVLLDCLTASNLRKKDVLFSPSSIHFAFERIWAPSAFNLANSVIFCFSSVLLLIRFIFSSSRTRRFSGVFSSEFKVSLDSVFWIYALFEQYLIVNSLKRILHNSHTCGFSTGLSSANSPYCGSENWSYFIFKGYIV